MKVRVKSYAKLNLTLDLVGKAEGYHLLDSLVCSVNVYDLIVASARKDGLVSVTMHGMGSEEIPPERNNALRAGEAFVRAFGTKGADVTVYKNIPIGAGMGGSSADAAGVIQAMAKLCSVKDEIKLKELADSLGSDTDYQRKGGFARMRGRGERLEFFRAPTLHFLLIMPQSGVSTAECFRKADEMEIPPSARTEGAVDALKKGNLVGAGSLIGNDLSGAACLLNGDVKKALDEAKSFSPLGYGMTGSGSAAFALFESAELCEWAKSRYRGKFRTMVVNSVIPQEKIKFRSPFALDEEEIG